MICHFNYQEKIIATHKKEVYIFNKIKFISSLNTVHVPYMAKLNVKIVSKSSYKKSIQNLPTIDIHI